MARSFTTPGVLFIGTLPTPERARLEPIFEAARRAGYRRFIEPACGVFAMSQIAVAKGWPASDIESSDISLLSAVLGYAITNQDLGELEIEAEGFDIDVTDPAEVLWAFDLARAELRTNGYWREIVKDMRHRRDFYERALDAQMVSLAGNLGAMRFRPRDLFEHLESVLDDQSAIVSLNPPTIKKGYERFFDTGGRLRWKEPRYTVFDPSAGHARLREMVESAKALVIVYGEADDSAALLGSPIYARGQTRKGEKDGPGARSINSYLSSNRPEEALELAHGLVARRGTGATALRKPPAPILPVSLEYGPKSQVRVMRITNGEAMYYRQLWTHNFSGASAPYNAAVLVDGYVVGVFGLDDALVRAGQTDKVAIWFSIGAPDRRQRWNRLLTRLASSRKVCALLLSPMTLALCNTVATVMLTKHQEAKEHRGLMKMTHRDKDKHQGYRLYYEAPLHEKDVATCWRETLEDDERWRRRSQTSATD